MEPTRICVIRKQFDDLLGRWIAELTFEVEGHDQPYQVMLVSETGREWRSNGVRFQPNVHETDAAEDSDAAQLSEEEREEANWLYTEGNQKEIEAVVEALQSRSFLAQLETFLA